MLAERWREIESLYHFARELKPAERQAYLESACRGDETLRREVESLLAQEERAVKFLETDEPGPLEPLVVPSVAAGDQVGALPGAGVFSERWNG